jgi:hypothetical protein
VINTNSDAVTESIKVGLLNEKLELLGSTPNALELNTESNTLYVANGFDNAIAVVRLGKNASAKGMGNSLVTGYIPTEAYPGGIKLIQNNLVVTNLESDGANVIDEKKNARSIHNQLASISIISVPDKITLDKYTLAVTQLNLLNRTSSLNLQPRAGISPVPIPERIGEPSVFKHVVYIIKENKTYDQVFGDMKWGRGDSSLCIFGENVTPNMHALAKKYGWMDDFNASMRIEFSKDKSVTDISAVIVTDGSNRIYWINPYTQTIIKIIETNYTKLNALTIKQLSPNNYYIYANIYQSNIIIMIDTNNPNISKQWDMTHIAQLEPNADLIDNVLNGIVYIPKTDNDFYITGKNWNKIYQIELVV